MYIDQHTPPSKLQEFLRQLTWLKDEAIVEITVPGEGNMNVVLRVLTNQRSFILKQSRPYVQKYQQIEAPLERISTEMEFYRAVRGRGIDNHLPNVLNFSQAEYLLMLEDVGHCRDMTSIYENRTIQQNELEKLVNIACSIHSSQCPGHYPENLILRSLNHQHIFVLPFAEDNGFQLDDIQNGLQELSKVIKKDVHLKKIVSDTGEHYLSKGDHLIHGDYYPGSWMIADDHLYVIDPEFSFIGCREFDLGVMAAHLMMANMHDDYIEIIGELYNDNVDIALFSKFTGIEIIRRLIGLAQLPLVRSLEEKAALLNIGRQLILR